MDMSMATDNYVDPPLLPPSPPPGEYYSRTKFRYKEEQIPGIIRAATYHNKDFALSTIWFSRSEHRGVHTSICVPFTRFTNVGLGTLDRLPIELLVDILVFRQLDVRTLFKFRHVNRRASQVVASLQEYRVMVSYGLNALCALLRTRLSVHVTLSEFYQAVTTKNCVLCHSFAGFVFLPTWMRCCLQCLQKATETRIETFSTVQKNFKLTEEQCEQLRYFWPLPGRYSLGPYWSQGRTNVRLVSVYQTMSALELKIPKRDLRHFETQIGYGKYRYMAACALPFFDVRTGTVELGVSCSGCQLAIEKRIIDWKAPKFASVRSQIYAPEEFLEHFKWCEQAQLLYKTSENGTIEPPQKPRIARDGGCFFPEE